MIIAVSRAERFSPNSVEKDAKILDCLCKALMHYGYDVETSGEEAIGLSVKKRVYVSMARSTEALDFLSEAEARGAVVMNDPHAVVLCQNRRLLMERLRREGIATSTECGGKESASGYWIKKNRGYSEQADDVCFAANDAERDEMVEAMRRRGIDDVYVTPHIEGDLVKFYGVAGTDFFRTFYPGDDGQFKFEQEKVNGKPSHYAFDERKLQHDIDRAARAVGLDFYGGDVVISAEGEATVIDLNDWPSYSRCREEAARAMALAVVGKVLQKGKRPLLPLGSHAGVRAIIFDYGGTLDTGGTHWGKQLWHAYERQGVPVTEEIFREAYVHAERTLGKNPIIKPDFTFRRTLETKVDIELDYIAQRVEGFRAADWAERIVDDLYAETLRHTARSLTVLKQLAEKMPMVLVSNFYGNVSTVLREMKLEGLFRSVVESAVVGIRKPDPRIFTLGVEALGVDASEVVVVGDSYDKDIEPAKAAGCRTAWYIGEGWTDGIADGKAADVVITSLTELLS